MAVPRTGRWWPTGVAWGLWALTLAGLGATLWLDALLRQDGYPELAYLLGTGNATTLVAAISAATVGALVAGRRPDHRVGWLLAGMGLSIAVAGFSFSYTRYGLVARPGALPAASWLAGIANGGVFLYLSCTGFILLLSPTGTLPSPRWRWWARITAAGLVAAFLTAVLHPRPLYPEYPEIRNPLGIDALEHGVGAAIFPVGALLVLAGLVVGAVSLLLRFRRARGLERLQLRWLALGAALAAMAFLVSLTALVVEESDGWLFQAALGISVAVLPLATGAAILRYRLYDIDRIISRTLAYALLTVLLGLGYAAVPSGSAGSWAGTPASPWPRPPWSWPPPSSRCAAGSRPWSTGASTAAATTPPGPSSISRPASATRSTCGPCTASCWPWSTRPCSRPMPLSGCAPRSLPRAPSAPMTLDRDGQTVKAARNRSRARTGSPEAQPSRATTPV